MEEKSVRHGFIAGLLQPLESFLTFDMNTEQFLAYTGLRDEAAITALINSSESDPSGINRASLMFVVNTLLGMVKRLDDKTVISLYLLPHLKCMVRLIRNLNEMWKPEMQAKCCSVIRDAVFSPVTETDKRHLLELPQTNKSEEKELSKSVGHRLQTFFSTIHENAFSLMGSSVTYATPQLESGELLLLMSVLEDAKYLPRLKLRMIFKSFLRPVLVRYANEESFRRNILLPLSTHFLPFLFRKIDSRWDLFKSSSSHDRHKETTPDQEQEFLEEELIEDQSNRVLSREFIDLLRVMMLQNTSSPLHESEGRGKSATPVDENVQVSCESEMRDVTEHPNCQISDMGRFLLQHNLKDIVFMTIVPLTWMDSVVVQKATLVNQPLIEYLMREMIIKSREETQFYLHHLFSTLSSFDENDQNQARILQLILTLYEGLVRNQMGEDTKSPFWDLSRTDRGSWLQFEENLIKSCVNNKKKVALSDRKKREALQQLLKHVIGVSHHLSLYRSLLFPLFSSFLTHIVNHP